VVQIAAILSRAHAVMHVQNHYALFHSKHSLAILTTLFQPSSSRIPPVPWFEHKQCAKLLNSDATALD